jgi:HAD superfamily hydrolase (TIGR01509 family)
MTDSDILWFLFDFDDVLTSGYKKGSEIKVFIDVLTIRKNEKITFQDSCYRLGLEPMDIVKQYCLTALPNKRLYPWLDKLETLINQKQPYGCGIASNNSNFLIIEWLKYYKLSDKFSNIYTPEVFNWTRKPERLFFDKCIKDLNTVAEQIVFFDDDISNIDIANKMGINAHLYKKFARFKEIEQYLSE